MNLQTNTRSKAKNDAWIKVETDFSARFRDKGITGVRNEAFTFYIMNGIGDESKALHPNNVNLRRGNMVEAAIAAHNPYINYDNPFRAKQCIDIFLEDSDVPLQFIESVREKCSTVGGLYFMLRKLDAYYGARGAFLEDISSPLFMECINLDGCYYEDVVMLRKEPHPNNDDYWDNAVRSFEG